MTKYCPFGYSEQADCNDSCALNRGGQCAITIAALAWASRFLEQKPKECPSEIVAFTGDIEVTKGEEEPGQEVIYTKDDIPF